MGDGGSSRPAPPPGQAMSEIPYTLEMKSRDDHSHVFFFAIHPTAEALQQRMGECLDLASGEELQFFQTNHELSKGSLSRLAFQSISLSPRLLCTSPFLPLQNRTRFLTLFLALRPDLKFLRSSRGSISPAIRIS
jgi:hypothetical protein